MQLRHVQVEFAFVWGVGPTSRNFLFAIALPKCSFRAISVMWKIEIRAVLEASQRDPCRGCLPSRFCSADL